MSHPNLSDAINQNIAQSEKDGGVWVKDIPMGLDLLIQTQNTLYTLRRKDEEKFLIKGHPGFCPDFIEVTVNGSTWGGSMLKMGWIGIGMHLEFVPTKRPDDHSFWGAITTSQIRELK